MFQSFRNIGSKDRKKSNTGDYKNSKPRQRVLSGFPLWVGGELLFHGLPQYHRRGGA